MELFQSPLQKKSVKAKPSLVKEKSEKEIQKEILAYLKGKGIFAWSDKQGAYQQFLNPRSGDTDGIPDIMGILREPPYKGIALAIEVKAKGGRIRQKQEAWLNRARECGAFAFIAFSVEDCITQFKEYKVRA